MTRIAFTQNSFWNTPLPQDVPIDEQSEEFVDWLARENDWPHLVLGNGLWSMPVYRPRSSHPLVTIDPIRFGPTVSFRLPPKARGAPTNDSALVVIDRTTDQDISLFEFRRDSRGQPQATGSGRYWLNSEGLHEDLGGTEGNSGHRGIPGVAMQLTPRDLVSGVRRRLKIAIPGTAPWHVWPMVGDEGDKGGIIGEGMILRLKPDTPLTHLSTQGQIIARGLKDYGAIVGDNGGVATLKCEAGLNVDAWALLGLPWSEYQFVSRTWGGEVI